MIQVIYADLYIGGYETTVCILDLARLVKVSAPGCFGEWHEAIALAFAQAHGESMRGSIDVV